MSANGHTTIEPGEAGRAVLTSPGGRSVVDLWALNDLLHDERTRQAARRILHALKVPADVDAAPYHLAAGSN